jgi:hypothetical protein
MNARQRRTWIRHNPPLDICNADGTVAWRTLTSYGNYLCLDKGQYIQLPRGRKLRVMNNFFDFDAAGKGVSVLWVPFGKRKTIGRRIER